MIYFVIPIVYSDIQRNVLLDEFITPIELVEACVQQVLVPKFDCNAALSVYDVGARDGRKDLFKEHMYKESYNFALRPSYYKEDKREDLYGTKATNAHDNAFFVWQPHWKMPYAFERPLDWSYV